MQQHIEEKRMHARTSHGINQSEYSQQMVGSRCASVGLSVLTIWRGFRVFVWLLLGDPESKAIFHS